MGHAAMLFTEQGHGSLEVDLLDQTGRDLGQGRPDHGHPYHAKDQHQRAQHAEDDSDLLAHDSPSLLIRG